jgi:hypothetical protein
MTNIRKAIALAALALAGCAGKPEPIIVDRIVEVKVPVTVPCLGERPGAVTALIDSLSRDEWAALTTDQRANLLAAQALERKIYGDKLTDASAGCR